jgi:hypothetical protein
MSYINSMISRCILTILVACLCSVAQAQDWQTVTSDTGNFKIQFPGKATRSDQSTTELRAISYVFVNPSKSVLVWGLTYTNFGAMLGNKSFSAKDEDDYFGEARRSFIDKFKSTINASVAEVKKQERGNFQNYPCESVLMSFEVNGNRLLVVYKNILATPRGYVLQCITKEGSEESEDVRKFMDSFELLALSPSGSNY